MRTLVLLLFLTLSVDAQSFQRNDVTFSGGTSWNVGSYFQNATPVSLGATYGFRFTPMIEAEAGVFGGINPVGTNCGRNGCFTPDTHFIWAPFGVRFIFPLKHDRMELSAGAGGLYENFSGGETFYGTISSYNGFGGYAKTSAAVALDRQRHFWLGVTPRVIIANGNYARDRWFMLTGDIGLRF